MKSETEKIRDRLKQLVREGHSTFSSTYLEVAFELKEKVKEERKKR